MKRLASAGGWPAIRYTLAKAREVGGLLPMWRALRTRNACKTCALGMGGQRGGMVNERGSFPEICKKSLQAMAADMQGGIEDSFWSTYSIEQLKAFKSGERVDEEEMMLMYVEELSDQDMADIAAYFATLPAD